MIVKVISIFVLLQLVIAAPTTTPQTELSPPNAPDSYLLFQPQLPINLQLPRKDQNPIQFALVQEPSTILRAPVEAFEPSYYESSIPSQDLVAPEETEWNPSNDPKLYYEVPVVLTKQKLPTKEYPKKYNEEIHLKKKPYSSIPKQELIIEPINEQQYQLKQKNLQKTFQKLAKKENQKQVNEYQEDIHKDRKLREPLNDDFGFTDSSNAFRNASKPILFSSQNFKDDARSDSEATASDNFNQGLSAELTSSLGIPSPSHDNNEGGDRLTFHIVGHDGPYSYKWGYDTGKGHNRQFRFEERDKTGLVNGHYGFYNTEGKLKVVHYNADPHSGFHAESKLGNDS